MHRKSRKEVAIREFMKDYEVDIIALPEIGFHGGRVPPSDNLYERTGEWFRNRRTVHGYNNNDIPSKSAQQWGGTALVAKDEITHRWMDQGTDPTGLGRWSWMRFHGKQHCITRVVSAYCPNASKTGPSTVYAQHLRHLKVDPIEAFWTDLKEAVQSWTANGESIILMGDWNCDLCSSKREWLAETGLMDPVRNIHGENLSPPTYNGGSSTIDAILVSESIVVQQGGYLGFDELPGDHRGIWIDITLDSFIGYRPPPIPFASARRLQLRDPRCVRKYLKRLHNLFLKHKIYIRMQRLMDSIVDCSLTPAQEKEFEEIDAIAEKCCEEAELKCRKFKCGGKWWSPEYNAASDLVTLWETVKKWKLGRNVSTRLIVKYKKRLGVKDTHVPLETVNEELDKAHKALKLVGKHDYQLSKSYREELAQAKAAEGKTSVANTLRQMNLHERQRNDSRRTKHALGKNRNQGTSKVWVHGEDGEVIELTMKEDMEWVIIEENKTKYHQTKKSCPLLTDEMIASIGLLGDGPDVEDILNGEYDAPLGTNDAARVWLEFMQRDKVRPPTEYKPVTLREFREGWKRMNEYTSSGKTHFGHFKAGCLHKHIGWFLFARSLIPFLTGYSPSRWRHGTDVMLLKKVQTYFVDKLRTIVLYEADYNFGNKTLGYKGMDMAIDQGKIAREQFSRPGRSAQDNVLAKRLSFDYARIYKLPLGMGASDLTHCYDRIVHNAASIALQRIGMPLNEIKCMFGTVQRLIHKIRTLFGDSILTYGGDKCDDFFRPPMGTGQGNGAAPTIWSILSSTIFDILHVEGFSTGFIFALSLGVYNICGFSYVDDCDLLVIEDTAVATATKLQDMIDMWDALMEVTGAALAPSKCWWYLIDFAWKNGVWKMVDADLPGFTLTARDKSLDIVPLQRLKYDEAEMMLGVYLAPNGSHCKQMEYMKEKATKWSSSIRNSSLDHRTTWIAFKTTVMKTFEYPLPALTLMPNECRELMTPVLNVALPRSGFARNFPRAVLYGPTELQGLGVRDICVAQYSRHIRDIVYLPWQDATTGNLVRANIEGITLEAGIIGPLFSYNHPISWFNTTNSWVAETHHFCVEHHIQFDDRISSITLPRVGDSSIMDTFRRHGYSKAEMKALNRCRLYCQVYTVSDIVDGKGTHITKDAIAMTIRDRCTNKFFWPRQTRPPKRERELWGKALQECYAPTQRRLSQPLGHWNLPAGEYRSNWEWFYSSDHRLFRHVNDEWFEIPKKGRRTRRYTRHTVFTASESSHIALPSPPPLAIDRATVLKDKYGGILVESFHHNRPPPLPPEIYPLTTEGLMDCLQTDPNAGWMFQHILLLCDIEDLVDAFKSGNIVFVSDGSFEPSYQLGSMAWCVGTKDGTILLRGGGLIPGDMDAQSAYRSEAGGLLACSSVLMKLQVWTQHRETNIPYIIGCDGESALYKSLICNREKITPSVSHYDILSIIQDIRRDLVLHITPIHIKGHQDRKKKKLTVLEFYNTRVDVLAKHILSHCRIRGTSPCMSLASSQPRGMPTVCINNYPIHGDLEPTIIRLVTRNRLLQWWELKGRFPKGCGKLVDWKVVQKTMEKSPLWMQKFIPKWVTSFIAVGKTMRRRKYRTHNSCPRCGCYTEDTGHVIRCKKAQPQWVKGVLNIVTWLESVQTDPNLTFCIKDILLRWHHRSRNNTTYLPNCGDPTTIVTMTTQRRLGWVSFLEGLFATNWAQQQQIFYSNLLSRRSGQKWAIQLSTKIWELVHSIWNERNIVLHSNSVSERLNGSDRIAIACIKELQLGPSELLQPYHSYFNITAEEMLAHRPRYQRTWLSIVRSAREANGHAYDDFIAHNTAIRKWIGL